MRLCLPSLTQPLPVLARGTGGPSSHAPSPGRPPGPSHLPPCRPWEPRVSECQPEGLGPGPGGKVESPAGVRETPAHPWGRPFPAQRQRAAGLSGRLSPWQALWLWTPPPPTPPRAQANRQPRLVLTSGNGPEPCAGGCQDLVPEEKTGLPTVPAQTVPGPSTVPVRPARLRLSVGRRQACGLVT